MIERTSSTIENIKTSQEVKDSSQAERTESSQFFLPFDLDQPYSRQALSQVIDEWGDKESFWSLDDGRMLLQHYISSGSPQEIRSQIKGLEVNLYSHQKKAAVAYLTPEGEYTLQVLADLNTTKLFTALFSEKRTQIENQYQNFARSSWEPRDVGAIIETTRPARTQSE